MEYFCRQKSSTKLFVALRPKESLNSKARQIQSSLMQVLMSEQESNGTRGEKLAKEKLLLCEYINKILLEKLK